ncbi:methylmalonyl-CoA mutase family protein [Methylopila henanensis]|uniref:Methylmalonyl-CoA mutase family protein n=1 Tax=Methylopila henanensis TaxID=873516 RepID=A0ABW4K4A1_9HYPH
MTTASTTASATAFAADFANATRETWLAAAEAALKGRPLDGVISRRTLDGVAVDAITERVAPRVVAGRPAGARWVAMTRIDIADPAAANAQALEDLNNGAAGLSLAFGEPGESAGVAADTLDRLDRALEGVLLDLAPIHLDVAPFGGRQSAALATALVERRKVDPASVSILFGVDVLRDLVRTGALPRSWEAMCARVVGLIEGLSRRGFNSPVLTICGRAWHNAGASEAQELAGVLASATEHVRGLVAAGLAVETAADAVSFTLSCDAEQFASIAKLRALRLLWAAWRRESGLPDRPVHIHVETSRRMMTLRDPHTNMVRTTIAAFAAGAGGADSIVVLPFTSAFGASDWDARRIARNAQAIILEESNVHRVADPSAGAGAIEAFTDALADAAWGLFREVEAGGGMLAALIEGSWQQRVADARAARSAAIARRSAPIVGVSEFPQAGPPLAVVSEAGPAVAAAPALKPLAVELTDDAAGFDAIVGAFHDGASFADIRAASKPIPSVVAHPVAVERLAEAFETLRARNEAAPSPPSAFLALVGPIARHSGRAGFIRNLLTAGGVDAVDGPVGAEPEAVAEAWSATRAPLAILCGSDDGYAEAGVALAAALKARGATVWLAGKPKEGRDELAAAGVARFVAAGDDALDILRAAAASPSRQSAGGAR